MNTDINGLIKEDMSDGIDRGRTWLEKHFRVGEIFLSLLEILTKISSLSWIHSN